MKNRHSLFIGIILGTFFFACFPTVALPMSAQKSKSPELKEKYITWLQEVEHIISKAEREAFNQLQADEQRDRFIEAFWKLRDPTPGTTKNEFREEHYRRLEYAKSQFGRGTPRPGWMTDQGKVYILLGEPITRRRFPEERTTFPMEIWFYDGDIKKGLPPHFNLLFFKSGGVGEYKLYSPFADRVQSLIADPGLQFAREDALYWAIRQNVDAEAAEAAFNLVPGRPFDPRLPRPTFDSQDLLNSIEDLPNKIEEPLYAQAILQGLPVVELDLVYKTLEFDFLHHYFKGPEGNFFLYYAWKLNPEQVSLGQHEDKYYFSFHINGQLKDEKERVISSVRDSVVSYLGEKEFEAIKAAPVSYQNRLPIIPGSYTFHLLVSNPVSKEYGTMEGRVYIPDLTSAPAPIELGELLQAYQIERVDNPSQTVSYPFQYRDIRIFPNFTRDYLRDGKLYLYFQLYCVRESEYFQKGTGYQLRYSILKASVETYSFSENIDFFAADRYGTIPLLKEIPLTGLAPGEYTLNISVLRGETEVITAKQAEFTITRESRTFRPLIFAKKIPSLTDYSNNSAWAEQYQMEGNTSEAIAELKKALIKNPDSRKDRELLGRLLLQDERYEEAIEVLHPLFVQTPNDFAIVSYLAICSYRLENFSEAVKYYEIALQLQPSNIGLLNATADAYLKFGNRAKAKEYFENSLKLDPNQPIIKKEIEKLKESSTPPPKG
ncbi:MAG: GWxTD domain-containing protein [Candidatus Aminicenantes bacterium]|nr:GWxTD domain-containing protein [Candidatus Aminicenantes bacterium]